MAGPDKIVLCRSVRVDAPANTPLQQPNATPVRSHVAVCRDAAGSRPRLLAAVVRLRATLAFAVERHGR